MSSSEVEFANIALQKMTPKEYVALGGCMHKLLVRYPIGTAEHPWEQKYTERALRCVGVGTKHLVTNIKGKPILVHETAGGQRWM